MKIVDRKKSDQIESHLKILYFGLRHSNLGFKQANGLQSVSVRNINQIGI